MCGTNDCFACAKYAVSFLFRVSKWYSAAVRQLTAGVPGSLPVPLVAGGVLTLLFGPRSCQVWLAIDRSLAHIEAAIPLYLFPVAGPVVDSRRHFQVSRRVSAAVQEVRHCLIADSEDELNIPPMLFTDLHTYIVHIIFPSISRDSSNI